MYFKIKSSFEYGSLFVKTICVTFVKLNLGNNEHKVEKMSVRMLESGSFVV